MENKVVSAGSPQATSLLGMFSVYTKEQTAIALGVKEATQPPTFRYSEETIRYHAEQNVNGAAWRVVYYNGLSLRELIETNGNPSYTEEKHWRRWWRENYQEEWMTHTVEAGYYLVNYIEQFGRMKWRQQEEEIAKLGEKYERCHEAVFGEAILTMFKSRDLKGLNVRGQGLYEFWVKPIWCHWGSSVDSRGRRVWVDAYVDSGLIIGSDYDDTPSDHDPPWSLTLGVAVLRKWDF